MRKTEPDDEARSISVRDFYAAMAPGLKLELLAGGSGLDNRIRSSRIQKLGLALAGYTDYLHAGRVQFIGRTEINYLNMLDQESRKSAIGRIVPFNLCCVLITKGLAPPPELLDGSTGHSLPILRTPALSSTAIDEVSAFLEERLAPTSTIHGTLMEVFGLGVLITGDSGVGKSECALDLILRGHRLVSDDVVKIQKIGNEQLVGSGPGFLQFHMELRGLGIMNIRDLFGISAVSPSKTIDLVLDLVNWKSDTEYDRLGLDDQRTEMLQVSLPLITLPVATGRNLANLVEVAVRLEMLKKQGYRPSHDFVEALDGRLRRRSVESAKDRKAEDET